jgi:hypothetical protein
VGRRILRLAVAEGVRAILGRIVEYFFETPAFRGFIG